MIGFTGASRTGKTTLARLVAETLGFDFVSVNTTEILKAAGFNGIANLGIEDRLKAQEAYLAHYVEMIETLPRPVIVDRTPIDLIGYMLCEVGMHATTEEQGARIANYVERAANLANRHFGIIFAVRPLGFYIEEEGKAPLNAAFQWHSQFVMEGAMGLLTSPMCVYIKEKDLEQRVDKTSEIIAEYWRLIEEKRASSRLH